MDTAHKRPWGLHTNYKTVWLREKKVLRLELMSATVWINKWNPVKCTQRPDRNSQTCWRTGNKCDQLLSTFCSHRRQKSSIIKSWWKKGLVIRSSHCCTPQQVVTKAMASPAPLLDGSSWTANSDGSDSHFAFRWVSWLSEETHLMSPKSFLFPAMATTMSSGPCSFSSFTHFFSVWKESWAIRNTNQLWKRCFTCICVKKKKLKTPVSESLLYNVLVRRAFHEQTRKEWHFIPWVMEKSVNFTPVLNCSI